MLEDLFKFLFYYSRQTNKGCNSGQRLSGIHVVSYSYLAKVVEPIHRRSDICTKYSHTNESNYMDTVTIF